MWAALDPRIWLAFLGAILLSGAVGIGVGYWKGYSTATASLVAKYAAVAEKQRLKDEETRKAAETKIAKLSYDLAKSKEDGENKLEDLLTNMRSGAFRPSVPVIVRDSTCSCTQGSGPTVAGQPSVEARADITEGTFRTLMSIAERGDQAILQANACIDAYEAIRKK